jgi:imidazolonepropionase-like amidohydrolase
MVAACAFLLLAGAASAQQNAAGPIYLLGANVLNGIDPEPIMDATVVVVDGRIERVEAGRSAVPAGARSYDLSGLWIVPGLTDAHSHVNTLDGVQRALESGVTLIRTAGVGGYADVAIRDLVRNGTLPGPDILATGVYVTPDIGDAVLADADLYPLAGGVRTPEELRLLVRTNVKHGVDWMKTRGTERAGLPETDPREQVYSEEQLRIIVEEAALAGVSIHAHAHGDEGIRAAVLAGVKSIEHGTYASEETLQLMRERGTFLVPTLSSISSFGQSGDYADPRLFLRGLHMAPRRREAVRRANELGIPIVTGADTSYGPESFARISREVGFLVDQGVSTWDAFRGATSLAAELLGVADRTGSIQPGLEADLLVIDRNPIEDVRALQDALMVMSNGHVVVNRLPFGMRPATE